jgi:hypothetical protein
LSFVPTHQQAHVHASSLNIYRRRFEFYPQLSTFPFLFPSIPKSQKSPLHEPMKRGTTYSPPTSTTLTSMSAPTKTTSSSCIPCINISSLSLHTLFSQHFS